MKPNENNKEVISPKRKGGLRKISDLPGACTSPEHNPPNMIVLEPGVYEYTCPQCGKITRFIVRKPTMKCEIPANREQ